MEAAAQSVAEVQEILKHKAFNKLYIGGEFVDPVGGGSYETYYPATGELLHRAPEGTAADVDAAVAAARAAWQEGTWAGMTAMKRAEIVRKISQGIKSKVQDLAKIEAADVGKPVRQSSMTLPGAAGEGEYFSDLAKQLDEEQGAPVPEFGGPPASMKVGYRRDPVGIVGLIGAWNYPLNVAFRKVAPALVAGNCAILKPSEIAGLSCMWLSQACEDAGLPKGALNIVTGGPAAGEALAKHHDVAMVSFTGSSATGGRVMASCAERLAPVMLELGGKSALVVFDDVDMEKALETVMKGFLTNGGQICTAHTRLVVHEKIKDELLKRLKLELEALPFTHDPISERDRGDHAWEPGKTDVVQPVVCEKQHKMVLGFLERAQAAGLKPLTGGGAGPSPGFYVQPTVFVDVPRDADVWQKEVFGPVLAVRSFSSEQQAVEEANSTPYGLAGTVMTRDAERGRRVANRIRAGTVFATATGDGILCEFPGVQRGGFGCSGVGRELGLAGLHEYTELKSVGLCGYGDGPA